MTIADRKQFCSGLLFCLIGVGTLLKLPNDLGTAAAMGPGYFPMLLGLCLVLLGSASMLSGIRRRQTVPIEPVPVVACAFIVAGIVAFSLLVRPLGLAVALMALIGLACYGRVLRQPLAVLLTFAVLLLITWFVFLYVVQVPLAVGPR